MTPLTRCPRRHAATPFTLTRPFAMPSQNPFAVSPPSRAPGVPLVPQVPRGDQEAVAGLSEPSADSVVEPPDIPTPLRLWSLAIDPVTMGQAVERIGFWVDSGQRICRFVVTPNVDHVVRLDRQPGLLAAYRQASMTVADGWPLIAVSRIYGRPLPERVAGADLLPAICADAQRRGRPLRLFLLGGKPGVPDRAAARIQTRWPIVRVCGTSSPPVGFEGDAEFNRRLCGQISSAGADILVVGLGFPKQECWLAAHRSELRVPVALGLGGTIDFLAGEQRRAPRRIRNLHLEWLYRLMTNPRRLAGRYLTDALWFPWIAWRDRKRCPTPFPDENSEGSPGSIK